MSTGGKMEIETLSAMNGGIYPSLPTMLEAIALITIILAIAGAAICLTGIAWLCFEETRQPARRRMKPTPEPPEPDEYELLAVLTALDDDLSDNLAGGVARCATETLDPLHMGRAAGKGGKGVNLW